MRRFGVVIPLIFVGLVLGFTLTNSEANAHVPSDIYLNEITQSSIKINWTHSTAWSGTVNGITDIDIMRGTGHEPATLIVGNVTSNSAAGSGTATGSAHVGNWTDSSSLAQGTEYTYTLCHPDPSTNTCKAADVNETHAGVAAQVFGVTLSNAPSGFNVTPESDNITLNWTGWQSYTSPSQSSLGVTHFANHTIVVGYSIKMSSDGGTTFTNGSDSNSGNRVAGHNGTGVSGLTSNSNSTTRTHEITGLETSKDYIFRIAAVSQGQSAVGFATGNYTDITVGTLGDVPGKKNAVVQASSYSTGNITDGNLQVTLMEDKGWDRILNVALYTNISANQTIEDSDTYIIWNYFDPLVVSDPHGYFDNVDIVTAQSGVRTQDFTYDITWNKPLGNNDVILEMKDFQSNAGLTVIEDAWTSFPVSRISHEVTDETSAVIPAVTSAAMHEETVMMLWDGGVMNHVFLNNNFDHALLSEMQYFVNDEVIVITPDEVVLQEEEGVKQLFEGITLSQDNVFIGHQYLKTLVISGTLKTEFYSNGERIAFSITSPDGTTSQLNAVTTSDRTFNVPIVIDKFESGIYQFQPIHNNQLGELFFFEY